jgi:hypothetical protein
MSKIAFSICSIRIEDPCSDSTELVEVKLRGMRSLSRFRLPTGPSMLCQEPGRIHLRLVFIGTASGSERGKDSAAHFLVPKAWQVKG